VHAKHAALRVVDQQVLQLHWVILEEIASMVKGVLI
jgi:hypothetical protein